MSRKTIEERFDRFVQKTDSCWLWRGAVNSKGYGQIRADGRALYAHRLAWQWSNGNLPDGALVLHSCDVRACVRPSHLRLGTYKQNSLDMVSKGRQSRKLTDAEVRLIRRMRGTYRSIAASFGVNRSTVGRIKSGLIWAHLTGGE